MLLHAKQIKAARAMLGWGQRKFAKTTGVSCSTLRRLEDGSEVGREKTYEAIRRAVEENGLEFTELEGVRKRPRGLQVFEGAEGTLQFSEHLQRTVRAMGGEILVISPSLAALMQFLDAPISQIDPIKRLSAAGSVKCLLWDSSKAPSSVEDVEFRVVSELAAWPAPYFIYGDRLCFTVCDGGSSVRFIVIQSPHVGQWGSRFLRLWEAAPLLKQVGKRRKR